MERQSGAGRVSGSNTSDPQNIFGRMSIFTLPVFLLQGVQKIAHRIVRTISIFGPPWHLGQSRSSWTVLANLGSFGRHWPKNLVAQHSPQNSVNNLFGMGHPVEFMLIDGDFQERKKQASKRHRC